MKVHLLNRRKKTWILALIAIFAVLVTAFLAVSIFWYAKVGAPAKAYEEKSNAYIKLYDENADFYPYVSTPDFLIDWDYMLTIRDKHNGANLHIYKNFQRKSHITYTLIDKNNHETFFAFDNDLTLRSDQNSEEYIQQKDDIQHMYDIAKDVYGDF